MPFRVKPKLKTPKSKAPKFKAKQRAVQKTLFSLALTSSTNITRQKKLRAQKQLLTRISVRFQKYMRDKTKTLVDLWPLTTERLQENQESRNTKTWMWQKKLRGLRHRTKEKSFRVRLVRPWRPEPFFATRKENLVKTLADRYKSLRFKDRRDFFRTYIGHMLLATQAASRTFSKNTWYAPSSRWYKEIVPYTTDEVQPLCQTHSFLANVQQKSWWYETLVQKRVPVQNAKKFVLDRPQTAFQLHWKQRPKEPWKEILLFRRALYAGLIENVRKMHKERPLQMKAYLRRKNPRSEKRNQLYKRITHLLDNYRDNFRIIAKKHARIQQLVRKVVWPFHGHLRRKQMLKIYQKSRRLQSPVLTREEIILSHFERRLDVVVYRLNLAPSILWARRLIQSGAIFIASANNTTPWEKMHASLKKIAFPLKLRDPQKLYSTTLWRYPTRSMSLDKKERQKIRPGSRHWATFRFLSCPQTKISYLLQPGDVVQCLNGNAFHRFKAKRQLYHKPIPTHLLTQKEMALYFSKPRAAIVTRHYQPVATPAEMVNTAVFLHAPRFSDLRTPDRIQEAFFRWTLG